MKTRYEVMLEKNRKRCSAWRKKNKLWLKRYRQRPHVKAYRRAYGRKYMKAYRARLKAEAKRGR